MSATILGAKTTLTVDGTSFSAQLLGTDALTLGRAISATVVPGGRGVVASQASRFVTWDFGFTTDSNSTTDPKLRQANGHRVTIVFNDGASTYTFKAILAVGITFDVATDRITYNVSAMVDGTPAVT